MSTPDSALADAFDRLGKREFMRQVAGLVPIDLDDSDDESVYIDFLIERRALVPVGWWHPSRTGGTFHFPGETCPNENEARICYERRAEGSTT